MKYIPLGSRLFLIFFFAPLLLLSQNNDLCSLSGHIHSENAESLEGISVSLKGTSKGIYTDDKGYYKLDQISPGNYTVVIYGLGYSGQEKTITLKAGEEAIQNFKLKTETQTLETVSVYGRSEAKEVQLQAYNVTAVDARKLHNSTLDLSHALDRVSGVRIRESGGLGSSMSFTLNGFTGRQVRFFIDGIPMENFGSTFQLNSIPINLADRIEVYKGVVPIWLGSDALGGAVNIVTTSQPVSYLDASYSFGSFNTHRTAINAGYTAKSGFTAQVNLFQNYSDNNYKVYMDIVDIQTSTMLGKKWVRRFHDKYRNEAIMASIGVVGKKYADKLLIGFTYGQNYSEIQSDARMYVPYGTPFQRGNTVMPTFRYTKKDLIVKGLDLTVSANYNLGYNQVVDTVNRRYNWLGEYNNTFELLGIKGAERNRTMYRFNNNTGLAVATLNYRISPRNTITVSNTFNTFNRVGSDELTPENASYEQPRYNTKNVLGLGYKYDHNERWNSTIFAKYYHQQTKHSEAYTLNTAWGAEQHYRIKQNIHKPLGYGVASTYFLLKNMQLKGSFERTYRLPEPEELFGDLVDLQGNADLRPETSYNFNLGLSYNFQINKVHKISIDGTAMYREVKDFIRTTLAPNQNRYFTENRDMVKNQSVEGEIRYSYKKFFTSGFNITYQNLRNHTMYEPNETKVSDAYKARMPNIPFLFGNADASIFLRDLGKKKQNTLSFGYNMLYVNHFYLFWPNQGKKTTKLDIPFQINHDLNIVYSLANGKYNIALECRNIMNNRLYDNFRLQKPGRAFYIKLRYFISKK